MRWIVDFYRSIIGKKVLMAGTGILLFIYVVLHLAGNLKLFQGRAKFNEYGEWLRHVGGPFIPPYAILWAMRVALLAALFLHVWLTVELTRINLAARGQDYARFRPQQANLAARTMRFSGVILLLFIIWHVFHLTTGLAHHDFVEADAYHNLTVGLSDLWTSAGYSLAVVALGLHLYHGLWSMFQSLGWNHPKYNPWRRNFAISFALVLTIGYLLLPLAVLFGMVEAP